MKYEYQIFIYYIFESYSSPFLYTAQCRVLKCRQLTFFFCYELQKCSTVQMLCIRCASFIVKSALGYVISWFCYTLLLDLPSESEGENLVHFIQCRYPLNIKAKLPAAGNFSLKQRVSTSTLVNFSLKVNGKKCPHLISTALLLFEGILWALFFLLDFWG